MGKTNEKKKILPELYKCFFKAIKVKNVLFFLVHTIKVNGVLGIKEFEETLLTNIPSNIPPKRFHE